MDHLVVRISPELFLLTENSHYLVLQSFNLQPA